MHKKRPLATVAKSFERTHEKDHTTLFFIQFTYLSTLIHIKQQDMLYAAM